jgi:hypothetical protein
LSLWVLFLHLEFATDEGTIWQCASSGVRVTDKTCPKIKMVFVKFYLQLHIQIYTQEWISSNECDHKFFCVEIAACFSDGNSKQVQHVENVKFTQW